MQTSLIVELDAALLQATITLLVMSLCTALWIRSKRAYFGWWAIAWGLYFARLGAILAFITTRQQGWLYWHQVITGWTALALLWSAIVFAREARWRNWFAILVAFPPVWSWIAIYQLQSFLLAAGPAVVFLSAATAGTGAMFLRYRRQHPSAGATVLGIAFLLWAVHHLDYPVLRARGIWTPWGYYLDILFTLAVGAGILLLVNSELTERLHARSKQLEHLSRRMVRQHEEERRRLSLALHDETAQALAALRLQLGTVAERVDETNRPRVERALALVDSSLNGIRNLTNALRPSLLDDLGLLPALRSLVADFEERHERQVEFVATESLPVVSHDVETVIYRALQEGLSNVARHAMARHIRVTLGASHGWLELRIQDDGRGFQMENDLDRYEANGHLGLAGMRARAAGVDGELHVRSTPQRGVTLALRVPVAGTDS